uniref:Uncharacterized protein n=1 Tax=Parascaris equorum TaxID=6256 RepID=A0A914S1W7_PAREQ
MLPSRAIPFLARQARLRRLLPSRTSLGAIRSKFVFGKEALGANVPVGGHMGAPEDPELHTYDGVYRGTPSKGDKPIPEYVEFFAFAFRCAYWIGAFICKLVSL